MYLQTHVSQEEDVNQQVDPERDLLPFLELLKEIERVEVRPGESYGEADQDDQCLCDLVGHTLDQVGTSLYVGTVVAGHFEHVKFTLSLVIRLISVVEQLLVREETRAVHGDAS